MPRSYRARPLHRRSRRAARHAARRHPALAARPRGHRLDRHRRGAALPGVAARPHRRGPRRDHRRPGRRRARRRSSARRSPMDRVRYVGEPVAVVLSPRPLRRGRRARPDRGRPTRRCPPWSIRSPRSRRCAGAARGGRQQSRQRPLASATAIRTRRSPRRRTAFSVTTHYPRNTGSPMETYGVVAEYDPHDERLRRAGQFPGAVQHPRGDRARAEGAGQPAAAARCRPIPAAASASSRASRPTSC